MKTTALISATTSLFIGMLLAACSTSPGSHERVPMSTGSKGGGSESMKLLQAINGYRSSIGKDPLTRNAGLERLAKHHNAYMAKNRGSFTLGSDNITHSGFDDRVIFATRSLGMESVAENVAGAPISGPIAPQLVRAWKDSNKHLYNLKQDWDATGIDVRVEPDGMVYATQIFATRNGSHFANTDRFRQF